MSGDMEPPARRQRSIDRIPVLLHMVNCFDQAVLIPGKVIITLRRVPQV
jgi:hypothetical protein